MWPLFLYLVFPFSYNYLVTFLNTALLLNGDCYINLLLVYWNKLLECKLYHSDREINANNFFLEWKKVTVHWQNVTNFTHTCKDCFLQFRISCAIKFVHVKGKPFSWVEMFYIELCQNSSSMIPDFWLTICASIEF